MDGGKIVVDCGQPGWSCRTGGSVEITTAVGAVHAAEGWAEEAPTDQSYWWAWTQRDSASERMYAWSKADPGEVEIPDAGTSKASAWSGCSLT